MTTAELVLSALLALCGFTLLGILITARRILAIDRKLLLEVRESQGYIVKILVRTTSDLLVALHALERQESKEAERRFG
jgi:hypothetical protein